MEESEVTTEVTAEQAAFNAVFAEAPADPVETPSEETEQVETATETPPSDELTDLRAKVERIPDLLKRIDDVNGRYGRVVQQVKELQDKIATAATPAAAKIAAADASEYLKEMDAEGFEDLAKLIRPSLAKMIDENKGIAKTEVSQITRQELEAARNAESSARVEKAQAVLTEAHPDWAEVRRTDEFKAWLDTLAPRARNQFLSSDDPYYVADRLDDFKAHRSATQKAADEKQNKQRRIERAIQPDGTRSPPKGNAGMSEQDAFNAVFRKRNK